ncbi:MAG: hypothetical protein P9L97_00945 [Candidatus Tenebribacter davisii]|jgi:hypothetical protein|nr:hypothetical protein [Candidatus Tenebribacter davisii]
MKLINIYINVDKSFEKKAQYVFSTFAKILGIKCQFFTKITKEPIHIYYGVKTKDEYPIHIFHGPHVSDFFQEHEDYPDKDVNLVKYKMTYIPFLFSRKGNILRFTANSIRIRKDIIASAFYFLSCWQEYTCKKEISPSSPYDFKSSIQYKFNFTEIATVDRYCELLEDILVRTFQEFVRSNIWPEGKKFAVSLSHNIEYWNFWTKAYLKQFNQERKEHPNGKYFRTLFKMLKHRIDKKFFYEPSAFIKKIIRKEKQLRTTSTFFILTKNDFPDLRRNYFGDEYIFQQLVKLLKDKSVNLFGSKEAGFQYHFLPPEMDKLTGFTANGFRVRYLNLNYQHLFSTLEKGNVKYDSSIGFNEHIGYRAGISYPFNPYKIDEDRPFNLLEIPIIAMDNSLMKQNDGNLKRAEKKIYRLIRSSRLHRSHISLSWHTHHFDSIDFPKWNKLYWKLLVFLKRNSAWLCSLDKMYNYWQNK